jgi:hypothetical protein
MEGKVVTARAYDRAFMKEVADTGSEMVYKGLELLYLAITLLVAISFTYTLNFESSVVNGKEILDKVRSNQNIVEVRWSGKHEVDY